MKPHLLSVLILAAVPMLAQLPAPNAAGVSAGHEHLVVRDMEAHTRFWTTLGGVPATLGQLNLIRFPGVYIMLRQGTPTAGTEGSTIEYIGFKVPNLKDSLAKWQAAGVKAMPGATAKQAFVMAPDDIKLRITEDTSLKRPIASDELKMNVSNAAEVQAWYEKWFGATLIQYGDAKVGDVPGSYLHFVETKTALATTKGRSLDHIGFEVKNLEALCKKLEAGGIKFDRAYGTLGDRAPLAVAFVTDPWGTYIELNEGFREAEVIVRE
jgi:catechol 2,3-dioxygenase-like lactoylglutathione lyase family enzyme